MSGLTETLVALLPLWGPWLLALVTLGSCLALPLPASLLVLSSAGLAAGGELALWAVFAGALGGALLGDQMAYALGRLGGGAVLGRVARSPARAAMVGRAEALVDRHGLWGVYLSRWLLSPLAPYVCYLAGAMRMHRLRFSAASLAGEVTWAGVYVALGYVFAESVVVLGRVLGNVVAGVTLGALLLLGIWGVRRGWGSLVGKSG